MRFDILDKRVFDLKMNVTPADPTPLRLAKTNVDFSWNLELPVHYTSSAANSTAGNDLFFVMGSAQPDTSIEDVSFVGTSRILFVDTEFDQ